MLQVIEIITKAREIAGLNDISLTFDEHDSGHETDAQEARGFFYQAYKKLVNQRHDEFKYLISFDTISHNAYYGLPVPLHRLANLSLDIINKDCKTTKLNFTEKPQDIQCDYAQPTSFSIKYQEKNIDGTSRERLLQLHPIPDQVYTIQGYAYESPESLISTDYTKCNELGDEWLINELAYRFAEKRQLETCSLKQYADEAWTQYKKSNRRGYEIANTSYEFLCG